MSSRLYHALTLLLAAALVPTGHARDWNVENVAGSVEASRADGVLAAGDRLSAHTALWLASPGDRVVLTGAALRVWSTGAAALRLGVPRPASTAQVRAIEILDGALRIDSGDDIVLLDLGSTPMLTEGDIWLYTGSDALRACLVDGQIWVHAAAGSSEIRHFEERYACIEQRPEGWHLERPSGLLFNQRLTLADGGARPVYMEDIRAMRQRTEPVHEGQQSLFRLPEPEPSPQ